ncbi:MAG: TraB/GumN family protein [Caulobacteraceae bacterium]
MRPHTSPLLLALLLATPALAQPPVWTVRDADSTVTIFGSVHVLPRGLDWRPDSLDQALRSADDLWFELPQDSGVRTALLRESLANGYLGREGRLSQMLSKAGRRRLAKVSLALGLPLAQVDQMRPWYAELTLSSAVYGLSGANATQGVEQEVNARAPATARRVALESPRQQIAMFARAPLRDQIASLEQTLRQIEASPGDYDGLVRAWMAGDTGAMERQALAPLRSVAPRLYARLVTSRNAAWTDRITERLKGSGKTVVVVGVGHLIGRDGVPARLRARGYRVEGPR